jgi:CheY-like chemotaxis protein
MAKNLSQILLADDDDDDRYFFEEALGDLAIPTTLTTVVDGEELMQWLTAPAQTLPDVLFLDLNMPRKSGYECLTEIKGNPALAPLPVVILSTLFDTTITNRLYDNGAAHCMGKPTNHTELKTLIREALTLVAAQDQSPPATDYPVRVPSAKADGNE